MKHLLLALLFSGFCMAQDVDYNAELARKLGADDYGMRKYVLVMLKTGDAKPSDEERKKLMEGHLANINKLAEAGTLSVAGPFLKNDQDLRGLFLFAVDTIDEAKALTETDPAVKAGMLKAEYVQWYASAALRETNRIHNTITKIKF
jgi:uncharacterized protein YciI